VLDNHYNSLASWQPALSAGSSIVQLSGHGSLEEQVQAAVPDWQQAFCSTSGCSPGHPTCLLISPAALGTIAMIKSFPTFNQVRIIDYYVLRVPFRAMLDRSCGSQTSNRS